MKRCICTLLVFLFALTLCACKSEPEVINLTLDMLIAGTTDVPEADEAADNDTAPEQKPEEAKNLLSGIFERLTLEKSDVGDFSCKKAYHAGKKCLEKQSYDAAAVWFYIAQQAERESRDDEDCAEDARQMYDASLGRDDVAAWMFAVTARELEPELNQDRASEYNDMLSAVPDEASEQASWIVMLAGQKMARLEAAKQYGTLSVAAVPLRRWEEDGFAPAEPLRPGETELDLFWDDEGEWRTSPDGTWEELWSSGTVYEIRRTDLEGNMIVTEYQDGQPLTTEERDAFERVHIRTNHRTDLCSIYLYAYAEYVPGSYPSTWEKDRFTHQYWFDLDGQLMFENFYNEDGMECIERLFYKNGEPSYRCAAVYDENGKRTGGVTYINAKTGEVFDPDADGYPD